MITLLGRLGVTHLPNPKETLRTLALCPQTPLGSDPVTERKPRMGRAAAKERSRKPELLSGLGPVSCATLGKST